jgi:hypothetical protein
MAALPAPLLGLEGQVSYPVGLSATLRARQQGATAAVRAREGLAATDGDPGTLSPDPAS